MREILFRGKSKSNGEWIEGLLYEDGFGRKNIIYYIPSEYKNVLPDRKVIVVDPETVCQFTGLTDKNGVKIFEGDIVKEFDLSNEYKGKGVVHLSDTFMGWYISESKSLFRLYKYEVIGNIFDNPELMEDGDHNET